MIFNHACVNYLSKIAKETATVVAIVTVIDIARAIVIMAITIITMMTKEQ